MDRNTALSPYADLIENPVARCACMLVLDVSSSMGGQPISELNEAVRRFVAEVQEDARRSTSVPAPAITSPGWC